MRTMTKERKKEGPRLATKAGRCKSQPSAAFSDRPGNHPGYILFNYIPIGAAVIIPFKNL